MEFPQSDLYEWQEVHKILFLSDHFDNNSTSIMLG